MKNIFGLGAIVSFAMMHTVCFAAEAFCVGDSAVFNHETVVVRALYVDGTADISYPNQTPTSNVAVSTLSHVIDVENGVRVGDKRTYNHATVVVRAVFEDATANISYPDDQATSNVAISSLNEIITTENGFYVDELVTLGHETVQIRAVFQDGTANISYPNQAPISNVAISSLAAVVTSEGGYQVGETVMLGHETVVIRAMYPDGTADISYPDQTPTSNIAISSLTPKISCEPAGSGHCG